MTALAAAGLALALAAANAPARVQVAAREFSLALSHTALPAGPAVVELVNYGEDPHDLRIQRVGARHVAGLPVVEPGDHADLQLRLAPGRYLLWCSLGDHRARGMAVTLVVRPR